MTLTADRPAPPPQGRAPHPRNRYSLEALRESKPARLVLGVALAAVVIGIIYLIVLTFTGTFTDVVRIDAQLPAGSNAVPIAAPVEYRNVTVGKVGSETQSPDGTVAVQFLIYPKNLSRIPKGVTAQVSPLSIFGNQYVNLVPPTTNTSDHLRRGEFVAAFGGSPSTSLQGTVTQLYNLLNAVHPADLDTALTAFATALNGEGRALGQTLAGTSDYLGKAVVPNLPTISSDISQLSRASGNLDTAAPNIVGTLSNSTSIAETITSQEGALHDLLTQGSTATGGLAGVLEKVQSSLPALINESAPLLADVTQSPTELSQTLSGLTQFSSAVAAAESHGPFLSVTANLPVSNISAGVNAALGYDNPTSLDEALGGTVDPATYTSANCPEYPGETNPYCGVGGSPDAQPVAGASVPVRAPAARSGGPAGGAAPSSGGSGTDPGTTPAASRTVRSSGKIRPAASPPNGNSPVDAATASTTMASSAARSPYAAELDAVQAIAAALNGGRSADSPGLATLVLLPLLSSMNART